MKAYSVHRHLIHVVVLVDSIGMFLLCAGGPAAAPTGQQGLPDTAAAAAPDRYAAEAHRH